MSNDEDAVPRLVTIDRRQLFLRTVDVEKLVDDGHCVRSIWELAGRLDLRLDGKFGDGNSGTDGTYP